MDKRIRSAAAMMLALGTALTFTGCGPAIPGPPPGPIGMPTTGGGVPTAAPGDAPTADEQFFVDGVLDMPEVRIVITDTRVIQQGDEGNEYGDGPVVAIWYDMTNTGASPQEFMPEDFIYYFKVFQGEELSVGLLPDAAYVETQNALIDKGSTASGAIAYELVDLTTPVELVASGLLGGDYGRMPIPLQ